MLGVNKIFSRMKLKWHRQIVYPTCSSLYIIYASGCYELYTRTIQELQNLAGVVDWQSFRYAAQSSEYYLLPWSSFMPENLSEAGPDSTTWGSVGGGSAGVDINLKAKCQQSEPYQGFPVADSRYPGRILTVTPGSLWAA